MVAEGKDQPLLGKAVKPPDICSPWESRRAFIKWAFPCFLVGCGGFVASGCLHYASYNFVHEMERWNAADLRFETAADRNIAHEIELNYTSMQDPVINSLGAREDIPMGVLDKVALAFPALFCLLCLVTKRVELWTKVLVCTALLALVKGLIGAITTVPDSSGWHVCRDAHLGPEGYAWMRQEHSFFEVFTVDTWWILTYHHPLRYCSDMMYSGHTFFVTLYALGLYEVALIWTHMLCQDDDDDYVASLDPVSKNIRGRIKKWGTGEGPRGKKVLFRMAVLAFVSLMAIGQQCGEIYFVLKSHFHYTSDVFVALLFTFLFYTNGVVTIFAKQWSLRDLHFLTSGLAVPAFYLEGAPKLKKWTKSMNLVDVESQHICGCAWSSSVTENPPYLDETCDEMKTQAVLNTWMSRGDIFLPVCCVPFCCLAGREHVYSDSGVEGFRLLVNSDSNTENDMSTEIDDHMHMHEGISEEDLSYMLSWMKGEVRAEDPEAGTGQTRACKNPWACRACNKKQ